MHIEAQFKGASSELERGLVLERDGLQAQVAGALATIQYFVVGVAGLGKTLLMLQDMSNSSEGDSDLALSFQRALDLQGLFRSGKGLVESPQDQASIRQIAQRYSEISLCKVTGHLLQKGDRLPRRLQSKVGPASNDVDLAEMAIAGRNL